MKEVKKFDGGYHAKPYLKGPMPLPLLRPPLQVMQDNIQEDRNKTTVRVTLLKTSWLHWMPIEWQKGSAIGVVKNGLGTTNVLTQFNSMSFMRFGT
jgi:hypothetical protein